MKNHYTKYLILIIVICFGLYNTSVADEFRTRNTGDWTSNNVWQENTANPNQTANWVNYNNSMSTSFANNENKLRFTIRSGHTVTLNSNLTVLGNNLTIIIEPGGQFIVSSNAKITLSGNNAELEINGNLELNGVIDFTANGGEINGDGYITGSGEIIGSYTEGAGIGNTLPIELLDFTAKSGSQGITITWITAAEINNDYFSIERSTDGNNWEILSYVQGAGNSNNVLTYNYEDLNPLQGISYYRLKQTDFDGQFEYFSPVAVQFNIATAKSEIIGVNSLGQQIDLVISTGTQNTHLIIADIQGRIIHTQSLNGNDSVQQISVNLPSSYSGSVVVVRLADNQNSDERKIRVF